MKKRAFVILLCAVLLCSVCARAEFSETFSALQTAYEAGTPVTLNASLTIDEMNLSDESKELLSSLLAPLSLTLSVTPEKEAFSLKDGEETVVSLRGKGLTSDSALSPFLQLKSLFSDTLPLVYERLAQDAEVKESTKSLNIKMSAKLPSKSSTPMTKKAPPRCCLICTLCWMRRSKRCSRTRRIGMNFLPIGKMSALRGR